MNIIGTSIFWDALNWSEHILGQTYFEINVFGTNISGEQTFMRRRREKGRGKDDEEEEEEEVEEK